MAAERDALDPIIGAILDGNDVAWPAADDTEFPQTDRQLLEPLRILAAIADTIGERLIDTMAGPAA